MPNEGMNFFSDPITLVAMAIAAVAGFKLWQILGRREEILPQPAENLKPQPTDLELKAVEVTPRPVWQGFAEKGSLLATGLQSIAEKDKQFDAALFLDNARAAHETILNAFAAGDTKKLESLLSKSTFDVFAKEIERRKKMGETSIFKFVRHVKAVLNSAHIEGNDASIGVDFTSELVSAIKDLKGAVISGDEKSIARVSEHWIFGCNLSKTPPLWRLAETHDAA